MAEAAAVRVARRIPPPRWTLSFFALLTAAPLAAILWTAAKPAGPIAAVSVVDSLFETAAYVAGSVAIALVVGVGAAWAVVMRRFPGRTAFSWLLALPLALPPYLSAYAVADFFRRVLETPFYGIASAAAITGFALYPYVYLLARASFMQQSCNFYASARMLGCGEWSAFLRVSLPMARPLIVVGASLAAMEALNDIALAEHLGVNALGLAVYDAWLNRGDTPLAARLSLLLALAALFVVWIEERARRDERQAASACEKCYECDRPRALVGGRGFAVASFCAAAAGLGFFFPAGRLFYLAARADGGLWRSAFVDGALGSLTLAFCAAAVLLAAGFLLACDSRFRPRGKAAAWAARIATAGYACPGAVLALGFILAVGGANLRAAGLSFFALGGFGLLTAAYAARFLLVSAASLEKGMEKIPPSLDAAARMAGKGEWEIFRRAHWPLLRPAAAAAAALIFMESIRELPMALVLRPHNFGTLSTLVYQYASDESLERAAPAAIVMILLSAVAAFFFVRAGGESRVD